MLIQDKEQADKYFDCLVEETMTRFKIDREAAEAVERKNLGYWAGYYGDQVREKVERLFDCQHPYFGKIAHVGPVTADKAFLMGLRMGEQAREKRDTVE